MKEVQMNADSPAMDPVAGHLSDRVQREDIARLGMWLFLSTEVLFFGALFLGFTLYKHTYPKHLNVVLGGLNTLVLLTSSFFIAMGVMAAQRSDRNVATRNLAVTLILALLFLGIKSLEWYQEFGEKLVPGWNFQMPGATEASAAHQQLFFCFYFIMTGIHGVHMILGSGVILWLILRCRRGTGPLSQTESIRIESTALYWHFVDMVWVFLLPLLYLTGLD
jgi:cytochrome c oxidase subunit 3